MNHVLEFKSRFKKLGSGYYQSCEKSFEFLNPF